MKKIFYLVLAAHGYFTPAAAQEPEMYGVAGFATVNGNTTGGAGGDTVTVSTGTELQDAIKTKEDHPSPMVILVDEILQAFAYDVSKALSVFVGLIITNCIIMGRLEAFALVNKPWESFLDGVGNAVGYPQLARVS